MQASSSAAAWLRRAVCPAALLLLGYAGGLVGQATQPAPDQPFAMVNQKAVTYGDFYALLQDEAGRQTAERVILAELLRQQAEKQGLGVTVDEVDQRVVSFIAEEFGGRADAFTQWMIDSASDEESVRRQIRNELLDLKLRSAGVDVTDDKLRAFFAEHRAERYDTPELVRYRQIVLDDEAKANQVLADLKAGTTTFLGAAVAHSVDTVSGPDGGLVPPVPLELLQRRAKPLGEALAGLAPNQTVAAPVAFEGKFFLLLLIEKIPGKPADYARVAERVRHDYLVDQATPAEEYLAELLKTSEVTGLPARYMGVQQAFSRRREQPRPTEPGPRPPGQ